MTHPTPPATSAPACEEFEPIEREYSNPKAVIAALKASSYAALAQGRGQDPTDEAKRLCPRSIHYARMADIWDRAAQIFDTATFGPSGVEPWMGEDD